MEAKQPSSSHLNAPVFYGSAVIILALVIYSVAFQSHAQTLFGDTQAWIIANVSWLYILAVALILLMVVLLAFSRYGDIKLGPDHSEPDYSALTWFAMLFSAGMGIGLMFFG
ncbi:MAG TPA: choline transporter, partial [Pseudomonas sp.]|nr:choline transporter [Pseudomonas sp.]